jgi:photosystem II stability/assembly factor-like uncharacterized protein
MVRHRGLLAAAAVVATTLSATGAGAATAGARSGPSAREGATASRPAPNVTTQPALPSSNWWLHAVDMLSATDGWAVGIRDFSFYTRPWVGHWDGVRWRRIFTPHRFVGRLTDVVALASDDVWSVGAYYPGKVGPLMLHWDGSQWRRYGHSLSDGALNGVSASGPDDVWAVGILNQNGLIEHWDGQHWHATQPAVAEGQYVARVAALAPDDVWATTSQTAIHWDGSSWEQVDLPDVGSPFALSDLTMLAPDDGWIVGQSGPAKRSAPIAFHWDGAVWTKVHVPRPTGVNPSFTAISALNPDDLWAVGYQYGQGNNLFIEHWDGSTWQLAEPPQPPFSSAALSDVDVLADDDIWTVGDSTNGPVDAFFAHWDGTGWDIDS